MATNTFNLNIIAANRVFFSGKCSSVIVPAHDGQEEIMAHHENMVFSIEPGQLRLLLEDGTWQEGVVGAGFCQVVNNRVTIIVDTAEYPEEVDIRRANEAKERAKEQLRQKQSIQEYYRSQASLARAMARLRYSTKDDINV